MSLSYSHETRVWTHDGQRRRLKFYATCSCGWRTRPFVERQTAEVYADLHELTMRVIGEQLCR